jgi:hypothetical protein
MRTRHGRRRSSLGPSRFAARPYTLLGRASGG